MRGKQHDAMSVDFVFYLLQQEAAGNADTEALNKSCLEAMPESDHKDCEGGVAEVADEEGDGNDIQAADVPTEGDDDVEDPESTDPTPRPHIIHDRVTAIQSKPNLTAVTYVKSFKAMIRELCSEYPDVRPATMLILVAACDKVMAATGSRLSPIVNQTLPCRQC